MSRSHELSTPDDAGSVVPGVSLRVFIVREDEGS